MKRFIRSASAIAAAAFIFASGILSATDAGAASGVEIMLKDKGGKTITATTDKNGEFDFRNMSEGTYTVMVRCVAGPCINMREPADANLHFTAQVITPEDEKKDPRADEPEGNKEETTREFTPGKKQHKPMVLTKDWSSVSTIEIGDDGSTLKGMIKQEPR